MTIKIIMDTDPGIDDAAALTMALNDPQIDLKLITSVAGNVTVDKTTKNAQKIVRFFNEKVPVAAGAKQPLIKEFEDAARIHGESGMPGYDFPEDLPKPLDVSAVEALHDAIMSSERRLHLFLRVHTQTLRYYSVSIQKLRIILNELLLWAGHLVKVI